MGETFATLRMKLAVAQQIKDIHLSGIGETV